MNSVIETATLPTGGVEDLILRVATPRLVQAIDEYETWAESVQRHELGDPLAALARLPGAEGLALLLAWSPAEREQRLAVCVPTASDRHRLLSLIKDLGDRGAPGTPAALVSTAFAGAAFDKGELQDQAAIDSSGTERTPAQLASEARYFWSPVVQGSLTKEARAARIAELRQRLAELTPADDPVVAANRARWLIELGRLVDSLGRPSEALDFFDEAAAASRAVGEERGWAVARSEFAAICLRQGRLEEALRASEEALRVHQGLGDERETALVFGEIADILQARGELDAALQLRREDELPALQRLGDVRAEAITAGKIADILQVRGEWDEALRIRRDVQLPVFERIGDLRSAATTRSKVADLLHSRGETEEALKIWRSQLPVFERLGDERARALTLGRIADVLDRRGDANEAIRIYSREALPTYERLGEPASIASTKVRIADLLAARGELRGALKLLRTEVLPVFERLGDRRSEALTLDRISGILWAQGRRSSALRNMRQEVLPVLDSLRDQHTLVFARMNTAWMLERRNAPGDRAEARQLLHQALESAESMRIPEAETIRQMLARLDPPPP
jgi:tetratricopeptide (TPR) repeat protein